MTKWTVVVLLDDEVAGIYSVDAERSEDACIEGGERCIRSLMKQGIEEAHAKSFVMNDAAIHATESSKVDW